MYNTSRRRIIVGILSLHKRIWRQNLQLLDFWHRKYTTFISEHLQKVDDLYFGVLKLKPLDFYFEELKMKTYDVLFGAKITIACGYSTPYDYSASVGTISVQYNARKDKSSHTVSK